MSIQQKIFAILVSVLIFVIIITLVKNKKLKEEYSWLWLLTASTILLLTLWVDLLRWITHAVGAVVPSSTIFLMAFVFLIFISLHFSVVISKMTQRNIDLAQKYALLELELQMLRKQSEVPVKDQSSKS